MRTTWHLILQAAYEPHAAQACNGASSRRYNWGIGVIAARGRELQDEFRCCGRQQPSGDSLASRTTGPRTSGDHGAASVDGRCAVRLLREFHGVVEAAVEQVG